MDKGCRGWVDDVNMRIKRMGWKRRLGKLDRGEEEETRHNQDEDMEKRGRGGEA